MATGSAKKIFLSFVSVIFSLMILGCASSANSMPDISSLGLLSHDCDLYIGLEVKNHLDLVVDLVSSQTGLSKKDSKTVAEKIRNLYLGVGGATDPNRIEISANGKFPLFAVDIALSESNGWTKNSYEATSSEEALAAKYPNKFDYFMNQYIPFKVSFPTKKEMLVSKKLAPMLEKYAQRCGSEFLPYAPFVSMEENESKDVLFYSDSPGNLVKGIFGEIAENWFTKAVGSLSRIDDSAYSLSARLSLADKNRKTVVMALLKLAGFSLEDLDATTIKIDGIKISRENLAALVLGGR